MRPTVRLSSVPAIAAATLLLASAACDSRRADTLARVRGGTMRVGAVANPPWTTLPSNGGAGGIEGALVAELARDLNARIEWVRGPESQLLHALELGELDLVIGGLTDASAWRRRVTFTGPFYTDTFVVAQPPGGARIDELEGRRIVVPAGHPAAAYVRERGGVPQPVADVSTAVGPVAAPTWLVPRFGFVPTSVTLYEARHVIALPPGDDPWREAVEQSVAKRVSAIPYLLRTSRP